MKIKVKQLQKALEIVKPGLASTEQIKQSTSFAFLGDRVVTYNDSISLSHPVEQLNLEGAIRAEELYEFLKRVKEDEISMQISKNQVKLKSGNARAGLKLESKIKLPIDETGNATNWEDLPEEFTSDLDFIKDSTSKDMSRRVLTCVNVGKKHMEASDGFQIMRIHMRPEESFPFPDTLIPVENIPEIIKIEPTQVAKTRGWLHFKNFDDTQLSCRILMDSYPSTANHLEVEGKQIVFPKSMPEILDKVMVFTKKDHVMDEEMEVRLKNNTILVHGKNEYGWFKEKAPVKYKGKETSFWITPYLLKNILERSNRCILGNEKIRFEDKEENWEYAAVLRN